MWPSNVPLTTLLEIETYSWRIIKGEGLSSGRRHYPFLLPIMFAKRRHDVHICYGAWWPWSEGGSMFGEAVGSEFSLLRASNRHWAESGLAHSRPDMSINAVRVSFESDPSSSDPDRIVPSPRIHFCPSTTSRVTQPTDWSTNRILNKRELIPREIHGPGQATCVGLIETLIAESSEESTATCPLTPYVADAPTAGRQSGGDWLNVQGYAFYYRLSMIGFIKTVMPFCIKIMSRPGCE